MSNILLLVGLRYGYYVVTYFLEAHYSIVLLMYLYFILTSRNF